MTLFARNLRYMRKHMAGGWEEWERLVTYEYRELRDFILRYVWVHHWNERCKQAAEKEEAPLGSGPVLTEQELHYPGTPQVLLEILGRVVQDIMLVQFPPERIGAHLLGGGMSGRGQALADAADSYLVDHANNTYNYLELLPVAQVHATVLQWLKPTDHRLVWQKTRTDFAVSLQIKEAPKDRLQGVLRGQPFLGVLGIADGCSRRSWGWRSEVVSPDWADVAWLSPRLSSWVLDRRLRALARNFGGARTFRDFPPTANSHWGQFFDLMYGVTRFFPRKPFFVSFDATVHASRFEDELVTRDGEGAWVLEVLHRWGELLLPNYTLLGDPYKISKAVEDVDISEPANVKEEKAREAIAEFQNVHLAYQKAVEGILEDWGGFTEAYGTYNSAWVECWEQAKMVREVPPGLLNSLPVAQKNMVSQCQHNIDQLDIERNRTARVEMVLNGAKRQGTTLNQYKKVIVGAFSNRRFQKGEIEVLTRSGLKGVDVIDFIQEPLMSAIKPRDGVAPSSKQSDYEKELHRLRELCDACTRGEQAFQFDCNSWRVALEGHTSEYKKYSKAIYDLIKDAYPWMKAKVAGSDIAVYLDGRRKRIDSLSTRVGASVAERKAVERNIKAQLTEQTASRATLAELQGRINGREDGSDQLVIEALGIQQEIAARSRLVASLHEKSAKLASERFDLEEELQFQQRCFWHALLDRAVISV